jgi:hypothetical protein
MLTQTDLMRVYDIAVDSLDDGVVKQILSSDSYKSKIYAKIIQDYKHISKSKSILKEMVVNRDLLPMANVLGEMKIETKNNGEETYKFQYISNEDIFWKILG